MTTVKERNPSLFTVSILGFASALSNSHIANSRRLHCSSPPSNVRFSLGELTSYVLNNVGSHGFPKSVKLVEMRLYL